MLSHGNFRDVVDMCHRHDRIPDTATTYLHLPLAHTFGLQTQVVSFDHGGLLAYCADPTQILTEIGEVRPTYLPSVPRIYEKIYTLATEPMKRHRRAARAVSEGCRD